MSSGTVLEGLCSKFGLVNADNVNAVLEQVSLSLVSAQEDLERVQVKHSAVVRRFEERVSAFNAKMAQLECEVGRLEAIDPVATLERRRNDIKTESEYLGRILNRDILEEFGNMARVELKKTITEMTPMESGNLAEGLDAVNGQLSFCDELSTELKQQNLGIIVSSQTERLLGIMGECVDEVVQRVYSGSLSKVVSFMEHCLQMLAVYVKQMREGRRMLWCLPQFLGLLLNDIHYVVVFANVKLGDAKAALRTVTLGLLQIRAEVLDDFVKQQEKELKVLLADAKDLSWLDRVDKRIGLYLQRLEKVLKPVMLRGDRLPLLYGLVKFVMEESWTQCLEMGDVAEGDLESLKAHCRWMESEVLMRAFVEEGDRIEVALLIQDLRRKHAALARIADQSLTDIVNCYWRGEYSASLDDSALRRIVNSIFASSSLKREFMASLRE